MRILSLQNLNYVAGGSDTSAITMAQFLTKKGHTVIPFAMNHPNNLPSPYQDFFVSHLSRNYQRLSFSQKISSAIRVIYNIKARKKLKYLIAKFPPDLAIVHNIYNNLSTSVLWELRAQCIPTVMIVHDYRLICPNHLFFINQRPCESCVRGNYLWCIKNKCVRNLTALSITLTIESFFWKINHVWQNCIDYFITPSYFMKEKMSLSGYPIERIYHIPHLIEIRKPKNLTPKSVRNNPYVLYFGRLVAPKGLKSLLKAWESVPEKMGHLLHIVGQGPQYRELKQYVCMKNIRDVFFLGHKAGIALVDEIENCSFTVLPSEWYENAPFVIYESYTSSRPVLVSDRGGTKEMVQDNVTGFVFKSGDVSDLQRKLVFMLRNYPDGLDIMGKSGLQLIHTKYNPEKIMKTLEIAFLNAIKRKQVICNCK